MKYTYSYNKSDRSDRNKVITFIVVGLALVIGVNVLFAIRDSRSSRSFEHKVLEIKTAMDAKDTELGYIIK